jgi:hypothetical protein
MAVPPQSVVKVLWRAPKSAGNARRRPARIFAFAHSGFNFMPVGTQRRCAMWRISNAQALIFIVAVVVMVALAVWIGR